MLRELLLRTKPFQGPAMLVAGSTWDFATLGRIDGVGENLLLLSYVVLLGGLLALEIRLARERWVPGFVERRPHWVRYATQFLFGGLFSAFVVFYLRSAGLGRSLLFVGLLVALLVLNELGDRWVRGAGVRVVLFFLVVTSFLLFFVPVTTGILIGLLPAGLLAMPLVAGVVLAAERPRTGDELWSALAVPAAGAVGVLAALLLLQGAGLVPAVPLSLREGGAFHAVERTPEGYRLVYEDPGPLRPWRDHDAVFHWREGDRVWCFSAVFAPTGLALSVVHRWEHWDEVEGWVTVNRIPFELKGGRLAGFRGYTYKDKVAPGAWRVRVETPAGREIGRVRFDLVEGEPGPLVERVY